MKQNKTKKSKLIFLFLFLFLFLFEQKKLDKILIVKHGQVATCGDTLALKSKFGDGAHITVTCAENKESVREAAKIVQQLAPSAQVEISKEDFQIKIIAGEDRFDDLPTLFAALEESKAVNDVVVGLSSMEDVFIRVADDEHTANKAGKSVRKDSAWVVSFCVILLADLVVWLTKQ